MRWHQGISSAPRQEETVYGEEVKSYIAYTYNLQSQGAALLLQDMYTPLSMSMPNHEFVGPSGCDFDFRHGHICYVAP